jgi:hypothetical protein
MTNSDTSVVHSQTTKRYMIIRKKAKNKYSYDSNNRMEPVMQWENIYSIFNDYRDYGS